MKTNSNDHNFEVLHDTIDELKKIGGDAAIAGLSPALDNSDPQVRQQAINALAEIGNEAAIAALAKILKSHKNYGVREMAASALGQMGSEAAIAPLLKLLKSKNEYRRSLAVSGLCKVSISNKRAIARLIAALEDSSYDVRSKAFNALKKTGNNAPIIAKLFVIIDDQNDSPIRADAVKFLGEIGSEAAIAKLINALSDPSDFVRSVVVEALKKIGSDPAIFALVHVLDDPNVYIRRNAFDTLKKSKIGSDMMIAVYLKTLDCQDSELRRQAIDGLEEIGNDTAIDALFKAIDCQDLKVGMCAVYALESIGSEAAIAALFKALDHHNFEIRCRSVQALGKLDIEAAIPGLEAAFDCKNLEAIPGLEAAFDWKNLEMIGDTARLLGKIGNEAAIALLLRALQHPDRNVRWHVAYELAKIGNEAAIDELIQSLDHEQYLSPYDDDRGFYSEFYPYGSEVRKDLTKLSSSAISVLGQLGSEATVAALIKALDHESSCTRRNAIEALGIIGSEAVIPGLFKALKDENAWTRVAAINASEKIGGDIMTTALIKALDDQASFVRSEAVRALGEMGSDVAIAAVLKALDDPDRVVHQTAAKILAEREAKRSIKTHDSQAKAMNTEPNNTLETLFSQMTPEQRLCLKQAVVQQTIYYVTQHLPPEDKDDGERRFIGYAQDWIDEPTQENAERANGAAVLDSIDGGVRHFDYSPYFLTPAEAAGAQTAIHATSYALEAAGDRAEIARQWQVAAAESILQGQALPELDDG